MEDKIISKEQQQMLFDAAFSVFRLYRKFGEKFPQEDNNVFRDRFAGLREAIDILGLGADYIAYVAHEGDGND